MGSVCVVSSCGSVNTPPRANPDQSIKTVSQVYRRFFSIDLLYNRAVIKGRIFLFLVLFGVQCAFSATVTDPKCPVRKLMLLDESQSPAGRNFHGEIRLRDKIFPDANTGLAHARTFGQAEGISKPLQVAEDLQQRARAFAADTTDQRNLVHQSSHGQLKLNLGTGELLLADKYGNFSVYTQAPPAFGRIKNTGNLFDVLSEKISFTTRKGRNEVPRLAVGQAIAVDEFAPDILISHYEKHGRLLGVNSPEKYAEKAIAFVASEDPSCVAITSRLPFYGKQFKDGGMGVMTAKVNVVTGEVAIIDRLNGRIVTYFKYDKHQAADQLHKLGLPSPKNVFEYLLLLQLRPPQ